MIPFLTYILGGATAVALSEFSKKRKMAEGGGVGSFLHLYKLTYPNGDYIVESYDGYAMSPKEAMEKMGISLRGWKAYKYKGISSNNPKYKEWYDKKNIGYSNTEAWDEVFEKEQMAEGGRVKKYPNLYEIQYDETVNDSLTKSKQLVLNEIDIVKKDVLAIEGKTKITSSRDAADIFYNIWDKNSLSVNENSYMLFLNRNNIAKSYYFLSKGGIDGTIMDVQIICGLAAKTLSKGVIVAHNHPSNNLKPSDADIRISNQIKDALNFLNVTLLDSLILTPSGEYTSLADNGSI